MAYLGLAPGRSSSARPKMRTTLSWARRPCSSASRRAAAKTAGEGAPPPGDVPTWQGAAPYQPPVKPDRGPRLFGPTIALVALATSIITLVVGLVNDIIAVINCALENIMWRRRRRQ